LTHIFSEPVVAIVVAAGSGSRLGAAVPKALVELDGVTLVRRSVDALVAGGASTVVVAAPAGHEEAMRETLDGVAVAVKVITGGAERQDSVALCAQASDAGDDAIVLVHDAARCLVPAGLVARVISAVAAGADVVIPAVPGIDSIRRVGRDVTDVVDRSVLRAVQTPQACRMGLLQRAHEYVAREGLRVTDDAAACESVGAVVTLVDGDRDAMKVTEPLDLVLAHAILERRSHP